jgi:DUF1680 family protein
VSTATPTPAEQAAADLPHRRYAPLPLGSVTIDDPFWSARQQVNRDRTIPHIYRQLATAGQLDALRRDWNPGPEIAQRHGWGGTAVMFWDSDVAKWIEAASYSLATNPDPALDALLDEMIALIAARQEPDGYLHTWFTTVDPANRSSTSTRSQATGTTGSTGSAAWRRARDA